MVLMEQKKHERFMRDQVREVKKHKLKKEMEAGKNLGDQPIHEWIAWQSKRFREEWEKKNGSIDKKRED